MIVRLTPIAIAMLTSVVLTSGTLYASGALAEELKGSEMAASEKALRSYFSHNLIVGEKDSDLPAGPRGSISKAGSAYEDWMGRIAEVHFRWALEQTNKAVREAHLPGVQHGPEPFAPDIDEITDAAIYGGQTSRNLLASAQTQGELGFYTRAKGRAVTALTARAYGGSAALTGLGTALTPEQAARFAGRKAPKHYVGTNAAYLRQYNSEGVWAPPNQEVFGKSVGELDLLAKLGGGSAALGLWGLPPEQAKKVVPRKPAVKIQDRLAAKAAAFNRDLESGKLGTFATPYQKLMSGKARALATQEEIGLAGTGLFTADEIDALDAGRSIPYRNEARKAALDAASRREQVGVHQVNKGRAVSGLTAAKHGRSAALALRGGFTAKEVRDQSPGMAGSDRLFARDGKARGSGGRPLSSEPLDRHISGLNTASSHLTSE